MSDNKYIRQIQNDHIGIVASSDENYAPHLTVMFFSLLQNCPEPRRINLYCIDGGISHSTKEMMQIAVRKAGGEKIDFIEFDKRKYDELPTTKNMTSSAYYRIAIPEIFADDVKKIIYLDCDMIVRGNVLDLYSYDIEGYHLGAVENLSGHTYRKLGIPQHEYFNSGMLLINLELWRKDNISDEVFKFKLENPERISTNDQCALNGVLHKKWKHLPLTWNQQSSVYRQTDQVKAFDQKDVNDAIMNPQIIHYISWDKPWRKVRFHPLAEEYDRYADQLAISTRQKPEFTDYLSAYSKFSNLKRLVRRQRWRRWYRSQGYALYES